MSLPVKPQWIAKSYTEGGRDHLGLGSVVANQILPELSPSINVLTFHPRYHSFYTFLVDEFWRRNRKASHQDFICFYRPREFIYTLSSYFCTRPEHDAIGSFVGSQKTSPLVTQQRASYRTDHNYIKSNLGGYGLYYRSVIIEMGLISVSYTHLTLPTT